MIKNGELSDADEMMSLTGQLFKNQANLIWNSHLVGINSKMNCAAGTLSLNKTFYNSGSSDTSDIAYNFTYDGTNKYWYANDLSSATIGGEYIIIEATSLSAPISNVNNCYSKLISAGKWIVYCTTGTDAVRRAQLIKTLFYGTNGSNAKILDFTGVTAIKTTHTNDVGKQVYYASLTDSVPQDTATRTTNYTGTFADTSTNSNCSSWSSIGFGLRSAKWEMPTSTVLNSSNTDELGTDTSSDEKNNPSSCLLQVVVYGPGYTGDSATARVIILSKGNISWAKDGGAGTASNVNYFGTHSIPVFTAAGTTTAEGFNVSTLIFGDTAASTVTDAIMCYTSSIDATSSLAVTASADGSNYVSATDSNIIDFTNTGTTLNRKFVITRTDLSKTDKIGQEAIIYNVRQ